MNDIAKCQENKYLQNKTNYPKNTRKTKKYGNEIFEKKVKKYVIFGKFEFSDFHILKLENSIFSTLGKNSIGKS